MMQSTLPPSLEHSPDDKLTARLYQIRKEERHLLIEFLAYLGEVTKRRVHLAAGFSSPFVFCTDFLGLSKSQAYRRTIAADLMARFPLVVDYLADGRLNLTTLAELRHVLGEDNLQLVLDRAAGKTEEEVKQLVATLMPRPEPTDLLRRLPTPFASQPPLPLSAPTPLASQTVPVPPRREPARIEPIADERSVVRVTVSAKFVADLKELKSALSHKFPDGDLEKVLHHAIAVALDVVKKKRHGAGSGGTKGRKKENTAPKKRSRYVPVAVSDAVWRRDEAKCAFIGADGRRCGSTHQVQIHHIQAFALDGPATEAEYHAHLRLP